MSDSLRGLVAAMMQAEFTRTHGTWVEGHLRLLQSLRAAMGNDLDKIIILAAIGQQQLMDPALPVRAYAPDAAQTIQGRVERLTNIDGLAAATGIPRESVRRKVNELIRAGWVERNGRTGLAATGQAAVDLAGSTAIVFDLLDQLFAGFARDLEQRGKITVQRVEAGKP